MNIATTHPSKWTKVCHGNENEQNTSFTLSNRLAARKNEAHSCDTAQLVLGDHPYYTSPVIYNHHLGL